MATLNPFDLLGDDAEDPSQLAVSVAPPEKTDKTKKPAAGPNQASAKLPSKPLPPAQAVREARNETSGRGGRGAGRGYGRGRGGSGGYSRDFSSSDASGGNNGYGKPSEEGDVTKASERRGGYGGPRGSFRGGRRGGFSNEEAGEERSRRIYERRSGTGRGSEFKREGSGRGNWGTPGEELVAETEETGVETEKKVVEKPAGDDEAADANKETPAEAEEEKEPEDKEMTLDEYEKILEEKRKALQSLATSDSERKVDLKEFESMQQLSNKKANDEIFIKLGSDKDKRKDALDKEEKAKKAVSINEFLKPAEGEGYYPRGGRGRGRGRGGGSRGGGYGGYQSKAAPAIEDTAQFPSLGGGK
ncbi:PREDICTED: plasminogen activator inhibitor 1 RNA-binding protein-like [Tarenaya hassleriana]|uniref:plasminogen activator inhibitor 1 RNA-binding protein-like n=1 Tax=Tarenaya hassleriana TaxID=28532 RepID=UPI00053C7617|nr:PREDICTED: plasminogen activator inhibitor 1 RNA-binding protein-like [Tarenaya hassleriana]